MYAYLYFAGLSDSLNQWQHSIIKSINFYCIPQFSQYIVGKDTIFNIYAIQQDTQSFLMIEFIHHIC